MDHFQTIGSNLREKWNPVNRFTPQMRYLKAFLESAMEKFVTMPHKLQTIRTSCKLTRQRFFIPACPDNPQYLIKRFLLEVRHKWQLLSQLRLRYYSLIVL